MEENKNIINNYQTVYIYSKRYLLLILWIIFWTWVFFLLSKSFDKHILLPDEMQYITGLQNPYILQKVWWIILPISQQNINSIDDNIKPNIFLNNYIYTNKLSDRWLFETKSKTLNQKQLSWKNNISIQWNIIKYFNLSCLFNSQPINTNTTKLCQQNLSIFVDNFPRYNIEEDMWNFEKIIAIANPNYKDQICQNILEYIYQKWKIFAVFDNIMMSCPAQKNTYNKIVELKKFTRDEQKDFTNKKYNISEINDLKMISWMQNIHQEIQKPKIDLTQIKKFLNRLYNKTYISSQSGEVIQIVIYNFNNFINISLNNYQNKNSLSTQDIEYIKNINIDLKNINAALNIPMDNIDNQNILTGTNSWNVVITNSLDQKLDIDKLIAKYLKWIVTESKYISTDKYIYKISIWEAKRWLVIIKTDNIWTIKTLLIWKQDWSYQKINDFSVKFDDSEAKRFEIFGQKSNELYQKLK